MASPAAPVLNARVGDAAVRQIRVVLPVLLTLLLAGPLAAQQPAFGPLTFEEGAPLQRLGFVPMMEGADVTRPGEVAVDLWLGLSNIFEQDSSETHLLYMDMERLLTAITVRWGAAESLEVGGRLTFETTGGGFLDPFVLWYHDALGFGQANRDRFPSGDFGQRLSDGDETLVEGRSRSFGLDDARLFVKWRAAGSEDGRSVLSLKAVGWLPAQTNLVGSRTAKLALMGLGRLGMGGWYLHGMLGASTARAAPQPTAFLRKGSAFLSVAVERSLGSSVSGVLQWQISTPLLYGFGHRELDGIASNIVFGLAGRWGETWSWDVAFQEDVPADTPAVDFTLGIRVSRAWR
ncbi:MAG TPA: DUF3187 family protein [Longimicrobiales bacterium]|nr:DUF3187 family protein [Longimicrobiales bacterium]